MRNTEQRIKSLEKREGGLRNIKVVGEVKAQQASRLNGLGGRSFTLELKQGPAFIWRQQCGILDNERKLDPAILREIGNKKKYFLKGSFDDEESDSSRRISPD